MIWKSLINRRHTFLWWNRLQIFAGTKFLKLFLPSANNKYRLYCLMCKFSICSSKPTNPPHLFKICLITVLFWVITQEVVAISYRRFGTTYRTHFHYLYSSVLSLEMGPIGCPETSVTNNDYSLRNNPEQRSSYQLRGERLEVTQGSLK